MNEKESANKSEKEKISPFFHYNALKRKSELNSQKYKDSPFYQKAENPYKGLLSVQKAPDFFSFLYISQEENIFNNLHQNYGNAFLQRTIQAKLKISNPSDIYEWEADKVADEVVNMPEPQIQKQTEKKDNLLNKKNNSDSIIPIIKNKQSTGQALSPIKLIESRILDLKESSQPLPKSIHTFFDARFGFDFSKVNINVSTQAADMADAINAKAFTIGNNVVFGKGQYSPNTVVGKRLLAHELTHVIQQKQNKSFHKINRQLQQESNPVFQKKIPDDFQTLILHMHCFWHDLFSKLKSRQFKELRQGVLKEDIDQIKQISKELINIENIESQFILNDWTSAFENFLKLIENKNDKNIFKFYMCYPTFLVEKVNIIQKLLSDNEWDPNKLKERKIFKGFKNINKNIKKDINKYEIAGKNLNRTITKIHRKVTNEAIKEIEQQLFYFDDLKNAKFLPFFSLVDETLYRIKTPEEIRLEKSIPSVLQGKWLEDPDTLNNEELNGILDDIKNNSPYPLNKGIMKGFGKISNKKNQLRFIQTINKAYQEYQEITKKDMFSWFIDEITTHNLFQQKMILINKRNIKHIQKAESTYLEMLEKEKEFSGGNLDLKNVIRISRYSGGWSFRFHRHTKEICAENGKFAALRQMPGHKTGDAIDINYGTNLYGKRNINVVGENTPDLWLLVEEVLKFADFKDYEIISQLYENAISKKKRNELLEESGTYKIIQEASIVFKKNYHDWKANGKKLYELKDIDIDINNIWDKEPPSLNELSNALKNVGLEEIEEELKIAKRSERKVKKQRNLLTKLIQSRIRKRVVRRIKSVLPQEVPEYSWENLMEVFKILLERTKLKEIQKIMDDLAFKDLDIKTFNNLTRTLKFNLIDIKERIESMKGEKIDKNIIYTLKDIQTIIDTLTEFEKVRTESEVQQKSEKILEYKKIERLKKIVSSYHKYKSSYFEPFQRFGFMDLPPDLIIAMKRAGWRWGGGYSPERGPDFHHFDAPKNSNNTFDPEVCCKKIEE